MFALQIHNIGSSIGVVRWYGKWAGQTFILMVIKDLIHHWTPR